MCQVVTLLWMHFIMRRRRPLLTILEFASFLMPLLVAFVLRAEETGILAYKQYGFDDLNSTKTQYNLFKNFKSAKKSPTKILYTPYSDENDRLMKCARRNLEGVFGWLRDAIPYKKNSEKYSHYANLYWFQYWPPSKGEWVRLWHTNEKSEIDKFIRKIDDQSALVIIFENSNVTLGGSLDYAIRMKSEILDSEINDFFNHSFYLSDYHPEFFEGYESFMTLQYAIETCYLGLNRTKNEALFYGRVPFVFRHNKSIRVLLDAAVIITIYCICGLLVPFVCTFARLVTFRVNHSEALLCANGVSLPYLMLSHFICVIPTGVVYTLIMFIIVKIQLETTISFMYIYTMLILHFLSVMTLAFFFSLVPGNTDYLVPQAFFVYFAASTAFYMGDIMRRTDKVIKYYHAVLLHGPLAWFLTEVEYFVTNQTKTNLSVLLHKNHTAYSYSVGLALLSSVLQILLLTVAIILLAYPYNLYCCYKRLFRRDARCFDAPPKGAKPVVHVLNASKKLCKTWAVKKSSFDLYRGEVTVLMGSNGSGKSTLLSMIAGVTRPSCGTVCVRDSSGWCPQRNLFLPQFTVGDHLWLFNTVRGSFGSKDLLKNLRLTDKTGFYPDQLSSGQQRRFQLACAMTGGTKILILDEPMAGMDGITRNEVWALLMSLRGRATVLLCNHHADTSNYLGDRVLALNSGRVTTHASPAHLKPDVYRLFMTHTHEEKYCECKVAQIVENEVPGSELIRPAPGCVSYYLPADQRDKFPRAFSILEDRQKELGVTSMKLGKPILKPGLVTQCSRYENHLDCLCRKIHVYDDYERSSGWGLGVMQVWELLKRKIYYIRHTSGAFLFVHLLLMMSAYILSQTNVWTPIDEVTQHSITKMSLNNYKDIRLDLKENTYKATVTVYKVNPKGPGNHTKKLFPINANGVQVFLENIETEYEIRDKKRVQTDRIVAPWLPEHRSRYQWEHDRFHEDFTRYGRVKRDGNMSVNLDKDINYFVFYDTFYKCNNTKNLVPLFIARPELQFVAHRYVNYSYIMVPKVEKNITKLIKVDTQENNTELLHLVYICWIRVSFSIPHTGPAGINAMWNARANDRFGVDDPITTKGWPIRTNSAPLYQYWNRMFEATYISTIYLTALVCSSGLSYSEQRSGARRQLLATDLSPLLFWTFRLIFHLTLYMVMFAVPLMIYLYSRTVGDYFVVCTFLIFFLGTTSCLTFTFMMSFLLKDTLGTIVLAIAFYAGVCFASIHSFYTYVEYKTQHFIPLEAMLPLTEMLLPPQTFTMAIIRACMAGMIVPTEHTEDGQKIILNVLRAEAYYPYRNLIFMVVQIIVFSILVYFFEKGYLKRFFDYGSTIGFKKPPKRKKTDRNAIKEDQYVKRSIGIYEKKDVSKQYEYKGPVIRPANLCYTTRGPVKVSQPDDSKAKAKAAAKPKINDAMLISDLHKGYSGVKPNPVRGLSFALKNEEIFGLYGISGCGKSSAYEAIVGHIGADAGTCFSGGEYFTNYTSRGPYQSTIAYSAERCSMDRFLTPWQALALLSGVRGIRSRDRNIKRQAWVTLLGMKRRSGRKISACSSGERRLASVMAACCVDAPVTLLDAACTHLDGDARRLLWLGLLHIRNNKRGVLLSQHSVDEMDDYCDRIAVMRDGDICAMGASQYLKFNYKTAFNVTFFLNRPKDNKKEETAKFNNQLSSFTSKVNSEFIVRNMYAPITQTIMVYQIGTLVFSHLFEKLERIKGEHRGVVRDYEVAQNTLDDSLAYILTGKNVA